MNTAELIEHDTSAATPYPPAVLPAVVTPMALLQQAVAQGVDTDKLAALLALQERWEANEARKAFVAAMTRFKDHPPKILKNKEVDFTSAKGRTHYKHATLDNVSGIIGAALAEVGISHRWAVEQLEGGAIKVTCILTHKLGHSESVFLQASRDESGNKNNIQAVGSTVTYLQRYTLLSAAGMAVADQDDDGAGGKDGMSESLKADWLAAIDALSDPEAGTAMWQKIASACAEVGDVVANNELRSALTKRLNALKAVK